jgi:hypothetical protein
MIFTKAKELVQVQSTYIIKKKYGEIIFLGKENQHFFIAKTKRYIIHYETRKL